MASQRSLTPAQRQLYADWARVAGGYGPEHPATLAQVWPERGPTWQQATRPLRFLLDRGLLARMPGEDQAHSLVRARFYAVLRASTDPDPPRNE